MAFSFVGIITAVLLASTVGHMLAPLIRLLIKNVYLQGLTGVVIGFILVLAIFKIAAQTAHKYAAGKYHEKGDFKYRLWDRLNTRLGLCLGLMNGLLYLVIASAAIYMGSYWSVQLPGSDMKAARVLNLLGKDLQTTGMSRVAGAVNQMPPAFYQAANVAGLIVNNPPLDTRLASYPAFISLQQMPEVRRLVNDKSFNELMTRKPSLAEMIEHPAVKEILNNPAAVKQFEGAVLPNLTDLEEYLKTGSSVKFGAEAILGRWSFDLQGTVAEYRREKPSMPSAEIAKVRALMAGRYGRAMVAAGVDQRAFLLDFPKPGATELATYASQWDRSGTEYLLTMDDSAQVLRLEVDAQRLSMRWEDLPVVFAKEQ